MQLIIKDILVKKLDAYRESSFPIERTKVDHISVNINIALINLKKIEEGEALIKTNFDVDIPDFGHIGAQIDTLATIDELDKLIADIKDSGKNDLPKELRKLLENSIFIFTMPLIITMAEKLKIPLPIPPLHLDSIQEEDMEVK